jgi:hypothetical protein
LLKSNRKKIEGKTSEPLPDLPTYFPYTEQEIDSLYDADSDKFMTKEELSKWDIVLENLLKNQKDPSNRCRVYAYLYTAQRDAAFLSCYTKGKLVGSVSPVSAKVLSLFFPDFKWTPEPGETDPYSDLLCYLVIDKVAARLATENKTMHPYVEKIGEMYWKGEPPLLGIQAGTCKPWFIQSSDQFRAPPPPAYDSPEWKKQLELVQAAIKQRDAQKNERILYWAGKSKQDAHGGDWVWITNNYLWKNDIFINKIFLVRSVMAMTVADALISAFDSKYTYWVKRPHMLDPKLDTYLKSPNHPSYPSGHSVTASTSAVVLSYLFPEQAKHWQILATEAGQSRIWCGIHFPIDNEAGNAMGQKIGQWIVKKLKKTPESQQVPLIETAHAK